VGIVLDTTVFIDLERSLRGAAPQVALSELRRRIERRLGASTEVAMASISASELLQGVHRASEHHRVRREAYVEGVLAAVPSIPFDLESLASTRVGGSTWQPPVPTSGHTTA
jgi:predicted nucleic acid-binding protein